jgi:hypothetical protein
LVAGPSGRSSAADYLPASFLAASILSIKVLALSESSAFGFLTALGFSSEGYLTLTSSSDLLTWSSFLSASSSFPSGCSPDAC